MKRGIASYKIVSYPLPTHRSDAHKKLVDGSSLNRILNVWYDIKVGLARFGLK